VSWGMWLLTFEEMYCLHEGQALFLDWVTLNIKWLWSLTHWHYVTSQNCIFSSTIVRSSNFTALFWLNVPELHSSQWQYQYYLLQWQWTEHKVYSDKVLIIACPVQEQTPIYHCSYSSTVTKRCGRHCNFSVHAVVTTKQSSNFQ
jgi:hypothetical protein